MTTTFKADLAETRSIDGASTRFFYRRFGPQSGVPLVLALRFRGTLDHWDPAFLDVLASERDVIIFDNRGTGRSSGTAPDTIQGLAEGMHEFLDALGLHRVDLLGWSLGGFVVQVATLLRPDRVRRLIVAGSGPGRYPGMPLASEKVWQIASKPVNDDEDFLYLFFPGNDRGRQAGLVSLRRLDTRLTVSHAAVAPEVVRAQLAAIGSIGSGSWERLEEMTLPVLVANGMHDIMVSSAASYALAQKLPSAKLLLYSDAGHAFLFQHAEDFGREVLAFLHPAE